MPNNEETPGANEAVVLRFDERVVERDAERAFRELDGRDVELWGVSILPIVRTSLQQRA